MCRGRMCLHCRDHVQRGCTHLLSPSSAPHYAPHTLSLCPFIHPMPLPCTLDRRLQYGQLFTVTANISNPVPITAVVLMAPSSATHSFNTHQVTSNGLRSVFFSESLPQTPLTPWQIRDLCGL